MTKPGLWYINRLMFIMGLWYRAFQLFFVCGQTEDNPSHYRNRRACTHVCDVGTGCKYWTGGVRYILV